MYVMKNAEQNTEQVILEAAEAEFMEKGYANTKMLSIARRAGVAHSMLHYYYRSKENLFQTILMKKMQVMISAYDELFNADLSFEEVLTRLRDARDRFLWSQNPQMPYFILTEILSNKKNREMLMNTLEKAVPRQLSKLKELFEAEIAKGNIRSIPFMDFMMLFITIDASSLSAISICCNVHNLDSDILHRLQDTYREHNMQLIWDVLRP